MEARMDVEYRIALLRAEIRDLVNTAGGHHDMDALESAVVDITRLIA